jgi:hypothetical protein
LRNGKMHKYETYAQGLRGVDTIKYHPMLEWKNPFVLLPIIELFQYRKGKYDR